MDNVLLDVAVRPWQPALEELGFPLATTALGVDARVLWLNGVGVAQFQRAARHPRLCEALTLFERLSQVDRNAWQRALRDSWHDALTTWNAELMHEANASGGTISLGVALRIDTAKTLAELLLVPSTRTGSSSPKFQALYEKLGGTTSSAVTRCGLPVRLAIDCRRGDAADATAILAVVYAFEQSKKEAQAQQRWWWIQEITIEGLRLETKALPFLEGLSRLGVRVPVLPTIELDADPSTTLLEITQALRSMTLGASDTTHTLVVGQPELAPLLLSFAQESQAVEAVHLQLWGTRARATEDALVPHQELWRWVVYTLFSRDAGHKITRLSTDLKHLRMAHVEAMRRILDAEKPLSELFQLPTPQVRFVVASRFFLRDPQLQDFAMVTAPPPLTQFESELPLKVRVIERPSGDWWRVLLPGSGPAWVHKDDAVESADAEDTDRQHAHICELVIESMDEPSMDAVLAFIRLVGSQLQRIQLRSYFGYQSLSAWCRDVFSTCPNLTDLRFGSANLDSLDVFLDCAEAGTCQLKRLEVTCQMLAPEGVCRLLHTLADPLHRLTKSLEHLKLGETVVADNEIPDTLAAVHRLLARNRRLHTIDLHFVYDTISRSRGFAIDLSSLLDAAEEVVLVPTVALSTTQRLAFAMIAPVRSRRLDANPLTRIFDFAGDCRARRVELRSHASVWEGNAG